MKVSKLIKELEAVAEEGDLDVTDNNGNPCVDVDVVHVGRDGGDGHLVAVLEFHS